jgi:hypothetical protein
MEAAAAFQSLIDEAADRLRAMSLESFTGAADHAPPPMKEAA